MNRLSRDQEIAIIGLWLEGKARDAIAEDLGISGSTVTDVISALPASLGKLRELNQYFRKTGLPALALSQLLKRVTEEVGEGLKPEALPTLVEYAVKAAENANYKLTAVVDAAAKIIQLETQSGQTYPEALKEYESKINENKRLQAEIDEKHRKNQHLTLTNSKLRKERCEAKRERRHQMRQARVTEKEIRDFKEAKLQLHRAGIDLSDARKLYRCINFMKESGGNPAELNRMAQENGSANDQLATVKKELKDKQDELALNKEAILKARTAAENEYHRMLTNRDAANEWQNRADYYRGTALSWEAYLGQVIAATQRQMCVHDAIVEQNIRNIGLNPEDAADYRLQKAAELRLREMEETAKTHAVDLLKQLSPSFTGSPKPLNHQGNHADSTYRIDLRGDKSNNEQT
jgi:hypothetical protein